MPGFDVTPSQVIFPMTELLPFIDEQTEAAELDGGPSGRL